MQCNGQDLAQLPKETCGQPIAWGWRENSTWDIGQVPRTQVTLSEAGSRGDRPLRTLVPTFGVIDRAQLLDVYAHVPGASPTSTAAAFPSRNYSIAAPGWNQRVEVQGFAAPVWQNASGGPVGTPFVLASGSDQTITIALPEAQLGTPGSGWGFIVVLTGQDGFSPDQARGFASTSQPFLFGVCAAGAKGWSRRAVREHRNE